MTMKFLNKNIFNSLLALALLSLGSFLLFQHFKGRLISFEVELDHRLTQIDTTLNYMAKSPSINSSILFKTFARVDQVVDELVFKDKLITGVYLLDDNKDVIYSKKSNYENIDLEIENFLIANNFEEKKKLQILNNNLLMQRIIEVSGDSFYLFYSISVSSLLNVEKSFSGIMPNPNVQTVPFSFSIPDLYSAGEMLTIFLGFASKNYFNYILLLCLFISLYWVVVKKLIIPVEKILIMLKNMSYDISYDLRKTPKVFHPIFENILEANRLIRDSIKTENNLAVKEAQISTYEQVAHDIRSPLAALDMAIKDLKSKMPLRDIKVIDLAVNRIHDIATDLISKSEENKMNEEEREGPELIPRLIQRIITEKRMQFRNYSNINIEYNKDLGGYGLFAIVNPVEFQRIISNLINNSIEALKNNNGNISIQVLSDENFVKLIIEDNGIGISKVEINSICEKGVTFGKKKGLGLGLYHAKSNIEKWNGNLNISSVYGQGTKVEIILPKVSSNESFVHNICIEEDDFLIVIDDDKSIHEVWEKRFSGHNVNFFNFTSPVEFSKWIKSNKEKIDRAVFLFDYEFIGHKENGIDLVRKFSLTDKSYLVTSRFEDSKIQQACKQMKLKLVDKSMAPYIPIVYQHDKQICNENLIVLIDDDSLVRDTWKINAENKGVKFKAFETIQEFNKVKPNIDLNTKIYIDSNLGGEVKGEDFARSLFDEGYRELYIATGYKANDFQNYHFLKGVVGKIAPF